MHAKTFLFGLAALASAAFAAPAPAELEARQCVGPAINAATISLIKEFEGFVKSPAPDPIGLPTVGYGHLCQTASCSEVGYSFPLTEAQATALLKKDAVVSIPHPNLLISQAANSPPALPGLPHHKDEDSRRP